MTNPEIFTNLGIGAGSLFIMWMMLQYFMKKLDSKDQDNKDAITEFRTHVEICNTNFIKINEHTVKIMRQQSKAFDSLTTKLGEAIGRISPQTTVEVVGNSSTKIKT